MKLLRDVGADKRRGGYYTPDALVEWCIGRVVGLLGRTGAGRWLEPSAGDGAFVRGIARGVASGRVAGVRIQAVELEPSEATKCEATRRRTGVPGAVVSDSFFHWAEQVGDAFDALVGNPPYVRYQFVPAADRAAAERLMTRIGIPLRGVSNLWIPFALAGFELLRPGGAFALVLPSELFATASGGQFREHIVRHSDALRIDIFPRDSFPDILQDVVVVSGVRAAKPSERQSVIFCEHRPPDRVEWSHPVVAGPAPWLVHLLTADEARAVAVAVELPGIHQLGEVARFEVAVVTGANAFFTVDDQTRDEFELTAWCRPLLAKTADAPGLDFTPADHAAARAAGRPAWLLDFADDRPSPMATSRSRKYLARGQALGLPDRYKCRIRTPWYRIPPVRVGPLLMTKRSHLYHRVIRNTSGLVTTDTVYRGAMRPLFRPLADDLVAGFLNSLTLLTTELEGRTYGGGVLELVPSEIGRLRVPLVGLGELLPELDAISRRVGGQRDETEAVLARVDVELQRRVPGYGDVLPALQSARVRLRHRRFDTGASVGRIAATEIDAD